jgi:hypothetical protein
MPAVIIAGICVDGLAAAASATFASVCKTILLGIFVAGPTAAVAVAFAVSKAREINMYQLRSLFAATLRAAPTAPEFNDSSR